LLFAVQLVFVRSFWALFGRKQRSPERGIVIFYLVIAATTAVVVTFWSSGPRVANRLKMHCFSMLGFASIFWFARTILSYCSNRVIKPIEELCNS
jgi:tryptophan-rich sensory protein